MLNEISQKSESVIYCSFCAKPQHEVLKLIAGPGVFICERCIDLCIEVMLEEKDILKNMPNLESLVPKDQDIRL